MKREVVELTRGHEIDLGSGTLAVTAESERELDEDPGARALSSSLSSGGPAAGSGPMEVELGGQFKGQQLTQRDVVRSLPVPPDVLLCCTGHLSETGSCREGMRTDLIGRRHADEEVMLDRRQRRDLESAIDPTVPKSLKGPDAPTESERTADEISSHPTSTVA